MTSVTETCPSAVPPATPGASAQHSRDVRQVGQQFEAVLTNAGDEAEATDRFLQLVRQLTGARGALYFPATADGRISNEPEVRSPAGIGGNLVDQLHPLLRVAQAERTIQLARSDHEGTQVVFVVPVMRTGRATECFVAIVPVPLDANERLAALCLTLQCLAAFVGQWRGRFQKLAPTSDVAAWRQFCDGIREATGVEQMAAAAEPLAEAVAALTGARCVALGVRRHASLGRILAVAPGGCFDPGSELARCFESVLSETMLESPVSNDSPIPATACRETDSVGRLRELMNREFVWQIPLMDASGEAIGGGILVFDSEPSTAQIAALEFAALLIGPQWGLVGRSGRARVGWKQRWRKTWGRLSTRARVTLAVAALGLGFALFAVPLPYRLNCPCEVQPVTRRYVVAPYEGRLEFLRSSSQAMRFRPAKSWRGWMPPRFGWRGRGCRPIYNEQPSSATARSPHERRRLRKLRLWKWNGFSFVSICCKIEWTIWIFAVPRMASSLVGIRANCRGADDDRANACRSRAARRNGLRGCHPRRRHRPRASRLSRPCSARVDGISIVARQTHPNPTPLGATRRAERICGARRSVARPGIVATGNARSREDRGAASSVVLDPVPPYLGTSLAPIRLVV